MWKKIISVITIVLVIFVAYGVLTSASGLEVTDETHVIDDGAVEEFWGAQKYSKEVDTDKDGEADTRELTFLGATLFAWQKMNVPVLLALIPEQALMYFAAGQIYFAFLKQRKSFKVSKAKLTRISLEINFVNHALPSGGASGLAYLIWRLKDLHVTAGQISFIHALRYGICAIANTVQTFIAIVIVMIAGCVQPNNYWALRLAAAIAVGIWVLLLVCWLIVRKQKNVDWLSTNATKFVNRVIRKLTRGKRRKVLNEDSVVRFFGDLRNDYLWIRRNRKILGGPIIWGAIFSFLELATYWVVGIAMGHPEILPQIMIAEGIASVVGTVVPTPGGLGGYEGAMVAVMAATGVDLSVSIIVVAVTRVCVLLGTILSGWGFYQAALMKREDKFDAKAASKTVAEESAEE
ncbi:flippase-like domain-containing protein [Candidatus Saccharibacteria bacterium]|nr:flippase-like domain-containing protein [Candidatus Saccharibacteria bacterium]